jgi:hypothetical protein
MWSTLAATANVNLETSGHFDLQRRQFDQMKVDDEDTDQAHEPAPSIVQCTRIAVVGIPFHT